MSEGHERGIFFSWLPVVFLRSIWFLVFVLSRKVQNFHKIYLVSEGELHGASPTQSGHWRSRIAQRRAASLWRRARKKLTKRAARCTSGGGSGSICGRAQDVRMLRGRQRRHGRRRQRRHLLGRYSRSWAFRETIRVEKVARGRFERSRRAHFKFRRRI